MKTSILTILALVALVLTPACHRDTRTKTDKAIDAVKDATEESARREQAATAVARDEAKKLEKINEVIKQ